MLLLYLFDSFWGLYNVVCITNSYFRWRALGSPFGNIVIGSDSNDWPPNLQVFWAAWKADCEWPEASPTKHHDEDGEEWRFDPTNYAPPVGTEVSGAWSLHKSVPRRWKRLASALARWNSLAIGGVVAFWARRQRACHGVRPWGLFPWDPKGNKA